MARSAASPCGAAAGAGVEAGALFAGAAGADTPFSPPAPAASTPVSDQTKKLQKALAKQLTVQKNLTKVVKLLTQNHTDAATILNEFEKIRTSELLRSEAFALAHVLPINDNSAG